MNGAIRPVSAIERGYLAAARVVPPLAVQIVVEGDGVVTSAELGPAVGRAASADPGARLRRRGRHWYADGPLPSVVPLGSPALGSGLLAEPGLRRPLAGCEILVAHESGRTTLVFRAAHALMDAGAALTWVSGVFAALRRDVPAPVTASSTDSGVRGSLATPRRVPSQMRWRDPLGAGPGVRDHCWTRRTVPGAPAALVARAAAALARTTGTDTRVMVPVDLRRHLGGRLASGNLSLPVFLDVPAAMPWRAVHAALLGALSRRQELTESSAERYADLLPVPAMRAALAGAVAWSRQTNRFLCSALITDLGRMDPGALTAPGFTADTVYALPAHAPFIPVALACTRFAGRTELVLSHPCGPAIQGRAEALLDAMAAGVTGLGRG